MTIEINKACELADERLEVAQSNLDLGLANDPRTATPLEASVAKMALTEMYSHRGDGFPTQYTHGSVVADHAETMWCALLTALRSPSPTREAVLEEAARAYAAECDERVWCCRIKYGKCSRRKCNIEGGWTPGNPADYGRATCTRWRLEQALSPSPEPICEECSGTGMVKVTSAFSDHGLVSCPKCSPEPIVGQSGEEE